jgi:hypothetical protein
MRLGEVQEKQYAPGGDSLGEFYVQGFDGVSSVSDGWKLTRCSSHVRVLCSTACAHVASHSAVKMC